MKYTLAITGLVKPQRHRLHFLAHAGAMETAPAWQFQQELLATAGLMADGLRAPNQLVAVQKENPLDGNAGHLQSASTVWVMEAMAARFPSLHFVVFYEAPWLALDDLVAQNPQEFLAQPEAALKLWMRYHKEVLRLRRLLGARLSLFNASYENAAHIDVRAHLHHLLQEPVDTVFEDEKVAEAIIEEGALAPALSFLRGMTLASLAPEYWDVYEALEACANLCGREPEFRQAMHMPESDSLQIALHQWLGPQRWRLHMHGLQQAANKELAEAQQIHLQDTQFLKQKAMQELESFKHQAEQTLHQTKELHAQEMQSLREQTQQELSTLQQELSAVQEFSIKNIEEIERVAQLLVQLQEVQKPLEMSVVEAIQSKNAAEEKLQQAELMAQRLRNELSENKCKTDSALQQLSTCQMELEQSKKHAQKMQDKITVLESRDWEFEQQLAEKKRALNEAQVQCKNLQQNMQRAQNQYEQFQRDSQSQLQLQQRQQQDQQKQQKQRFLQLEEEQQRQHLKLKEEQQQLFFQLQEEQAENAQLLQLLHETQEQLEQNCLEQEVLHALLTQADQSFIRARLLITQLLPNKAAVGSSRVSMDIAIV